MSKANRKIALPVLGALCSVLLLGGFDGCNIYIQPYPNEPEVQPEGEPDAQPEPVPTPEPGPDTECYSDADCPNGTVCLYTPGSEEDCYDYDEPNCEPTEDGEGCAGIALPPCGYGICTEVNEPQCEEDCYATYEEILNECFENSDPDDGAEGDRAFPYDECFQYADEFFGQCLDECNEPPPPPPQCEEGCYQNFDRLLEECFQWGGDEEECFYEAERELEYCLMDCGEPPPPPMCEDDCFRNFEELLQECEFTNDDECYIWAEEELNYCLMDCGEPPPPQCEEHCFEIFEELIRECEQSGDDECFYWIEEELNYCLMDCDEPPPPPVCEDDCFRQFEEILQECEQSGDPSDDCFRFAEENLEYCLMDCDEPPPPPMCENDCFINYEQIIQECYEGFGGDPDQPDLPIAPPEDCERYAEEFLGQCLESCDEPTNTCEDTCIADLTEAFEACVEQGQDPQVCEDILTPLAEQCFAECNQNGGECDSDSDCGDGQRCEIVEWCEGGAIPAPCDPNGNCDEPIEPNCGREGICVETDIPPPPPGCSDDADCGPEGRCEVQEYCYFNCNIDDEGCCFEESICVYEGEPEPDPDVCIQVEVAAADPAAGECTVFPTPCDVPDGWEACQ